MKFISIFSPWTIRLVDVHKIAMYLLVIINIIQCENNTSHIKWLSIIKRSFSTCKTVQNASTFQKIGLGRIVLEILHSFEISKFIKQNWIHTVDLVWSVVGKQKFKTSLTYELYKRREHELCMCVIVVFHHCHTYYSLIIKRREFPLLYIIRRDFSANV